MHAGTMTFSPDDGSSSTIIRARDVRETLTDGDYVTFGAWATFDTDSSDPYFAAQFESIGHATGTDPFLPLHPFRPSLRELQGTATYAGLFGGHFNSVRPEKADDESLLLYSMQADVVLSVDFGSPSDHGSVSGSVTNIDVAFVPYSGSLRLNPSSIWVSDNVGATFYGTLEGSIEGIDYTGKWGGQFFGNREANGMPGSAAGTLGGSTQDGARSFVGGFGARRR